MNICSIPVGLGELYYKYSILEIKYEKITDSNKQIEIKKEMNFLKPYINKFNLTNELRDNIKQVNEILWDIEDTIREKERKQEFDNEFIELARSVYKTNDERAKIKNRINTYLNSEINDIKSYV